MSNNEAATPEKKYFDLHTTGVGYLNRIREVKPNKGEPFLSCTVAALVGPEDDVEYRYFDCRVSGETAQTLVRKCVEAVKADKKVLVRFVIGDLWTEVFTYEKGEKKGKTGVGLKGRLLYIGWIKVNGVEVYKDERQTQNQGDADNGAEAPASDAEAQTELPEDAAAEMNGGQAQGVDDDGISF